MTQSPNLALPYLAAAQAQKHVTVNEALRLLDAVVMLAVLDRDLAAPPASPADGARYIVAAGATGAWAGHAGEIAAWQDGAWTFIAPRPGFLAYVVDEAALVVWDGTSWQGAGGGALSALDNLTRLGVGTAADATNPFAAKLNNALWTAKTAAEGGDGTLRYKMNKESAATTLSLLMQTGYSGRAEIGLTGDDDLHVKVSPDGSAWFEAIRVDRASGRVAFPSGGGGRETLSANRTYYVRTDGSDSNPGLVDSPEGAFLTIQRAIDAACALDLSIHSVTIQVGAGTYTDAATLKSYVGAGPITIVGDETTPANVVVSVAGTYCFGADTARGKWRLRGMKLQTATSGHGIQLVAADVEYQNLNFGAVASGYSHVYAHRNSRAIATGNYTISGNANAHFLVEASFVRVGGGITVTVSGTPAWGSAFLVCQRLSETEIGATFSGSATGPRYTVSGNSNCVVFGNGATYLPGNAAHATPTGTGGQYN
jgi:hypothetical protein